MKVGTFLCSMVDFLTITALRDQFESQLRNNHNNLHSVNEVYYIGNGATNPPYIAFGAFGWVLPGSSPGEASVVGLVEAVRHMRCCAFVPSAVERVPAGRVEVNDQV